MGLTDYLNTRDKRVRVETDKALVGPTLFEGININDLTLYYNYNAEVHTENAGTTHIVTDVPRNVMRILLDVSAQNSGRAAVAAVYFQRAGVIEGISTPTTAGAADRATSGLYLLSRPIVMLEGTALGMIDYAWQAGDTTTWRVRYLDIQIQR